MSASSASAASWTSVSRISCRSSEAFERAGGADDGAVLRRARGAALVGLQAGEAGGGLVGGQLRRARPSSGGISRRVVQPTNSDLADARRPRPPGRTGRRRRRGARRGRARSRRWSARRGPRTRRRCSITRAVPDGPSPKRTYSSGPSRRRRLGAAAVLADPQQADVVGAEQRLAGGVERSAQRPRRGRRGGLMGEAVERTGRRQPGCPLRCAGSCLPWIGVIGRIPPELDADNRCSVRD